VSGDPAGVSEDANAEEVPINWHQPLVSIVVILAAWLIAAPAAFPQTPKIVVENYLVPARDAGVQLYVRNKRPEGVAKFGSEKILLFVHGGTYPGETAFDLPLGGVSWMDYVAQRGFDVYLMDVRGYGPSTRPPQMNRPPGESPPIVHTDVAVRDVGAVVDHILARRGVSKINLLGWSWGTVLAGAYTAQNNDKIQRLVLYAPSFIRASFIRATPSPIAAEGQLGAYRTVTKDAAQKRRRTGLSDERAKDLMPDEWFDMWWAANMASDPVGAAQNPPVVRAPNGVIEDDRKYWSARKAYYDPSHITVPTLLILAEWDADTPFYMAQAVFAKLTDVPRRRLVLIGEGTHGVALEKNRMQLFREAQFFFEEPN
jgi:pimeloyl-ACP methyl ester carboxylesterase